MKNKKILLYISSLLFPMIVFAKSSSSDVFSLFMEAFCSIHISVFVFWPLSKMIFKEKAKIAFIVLFVTRACVLLYFDFIVGNSACIYDFFAIFVGAFLVVPLCFFITKSSTSDIFPSKTIIIGGKKTTAPTNQVMNETGLQTNQVNNELKCVKCGFVLKSTDKFCQNCGNKIDTIIQSKKNIVLSTHFNEMYSHSEAELLEEFVINEMKKAGINLSSNLVPSEILQKKNVLNIIFSILLFIYISLIFFHFPIYTYIIGLIILFIFYKLSKKFDLLKYIEKQVKARPSEKISNIVMNAKNTFVEYNIKKSLLINLSIGIILPLIIFSTPKIIYEEVDGGYAVRFYAFGLTSFKTVTIPETHNDKKVVSLRGNTFSNMFLLKSVKLPDTITEIRGQAFKNCSSLIEVNIPNNLEYLGGGAFYNATSIKNIELPDTLTFLGGESFYNASSLQTIKLSNNLTEIRGNTFENCTSLRIITIPDNIERIGGHAFYGNKSLSEVIFTENSKLTEIGSSAFRQCTSLYNITLPYGVNINERAFKESPTNINYFENKVNDDLSNIETNDIESNDIESNDIETNDIESNLTNNGKSFDSNYYYFKTEYYKNELEFFNNNMTFFSGMYDDRHAIYISGTVYNPNYIDDIYDLKVVYYDENYNVIGNCNDKIDMRGEGFSAISFACLTKESELLNNKKYEDIKKYKLILSYRG